MRKTAAAAAMFLLLSSSAHAAEAFIGGVVKEGDVAMVFDYLREAMSAAFQGREVAPPEALLQRAQGIAEEAKRYGETAARAALDAIEGEVRESTRLRPKPLPGSI